MRARRSTSHRVVLPLALCLSIVVLSELPTQAQARTENRVQVQRSGFTHLGGKPAPTPTKKTVVTLLWSQEFNGKAGRTSSIARETIAPARGQVWQAEVTGAGGGNKERQFYTDGVVEYTKSGKVAHYALELDGKGNLAINARRVKPKSGAQPSNAPSGTCWYGACEFVSGRINTRGTVGFQYGLIEARIKVPNAWNSWPAFWLLGANIGEVDWPACGEIDIMEAAANGARYWTHFGTLHSSPSDGFGVGSGSRYLEDLYTKYHVFGIFWDKTKVQWRLDGKPFFTATKAAVTRGDWTFPRSWPFDQEMFMILNVAMGGTLGGDANGDVDPDSMGGTMLVDWVRFSSVNGVGKLVRHS